MSGPTVVELFAGGGGLARGLHVTGWHHHLLLEWDKHAVATLRNAFGASRVCQADVNDVDWSAIPRPDLLTGGPPCQPFSFGGHRLGTEDPRNCWPAFLRAAEVLRPPIVIGENVAGMERPDTKAYAESILARLRELYPWATIWRMDAADFGAPQHRRRVFMVGATSPVSPPRPTHGPPASLGTLLARLNGTTAPHVTMRAALGLGPDATGGIVGHGFADDRPLDLDRPSPTVCTSGIGCRINESGQRTPWELGIERQIRAGGRRVSATSSANPLGKRAYHDQEARKAKFYGMRDLTVAELATLQGFPADWPWGAGSTATKRQIGNAVSVHQAVALGRAVRAWLESQ